VPKCSIPLYQPWIPCWVGCSCAVFLYHDWGRGLLIFVRSRVQPCPRQHFPVPPHRHGSPRLAAAIRSRFQPHCVRAAFRPASHCVWGAWDGGQREEPRARARWASPRSWCALVCGLGVAVISPDSAEGLVALSVVAMQWSCSVGVMCLVVGCEGVGISNLGGICL
jgi:hypothetical protein